jgi:thioesterase domain-containing protein/acyl carrier protein
MTIARDSTGQFQRGQSDALPEAIFASPAWYLEHSLWIADATSPGNAAHNYPLAMRIRGPLNQEALAHGLQEMMRRHRVLRSAFRIEDGKAAQLIMPVRPVSMPLLDLTGFPEDVREAKAQEAVFEDARQLFDLTRGPMLRTLLIRLQPEEHILLLTTHHVACDYWSTRVLIRDLFALYAVASASGRSPLPESGLSGPDLLKPGFEYADYVQWLETRLQAKEPELMGFWRERIAGKDFHHLSVDHEAPIPRSYRGACERAILSEELINSIKQLSVRERLSPFMIMLAGLQCLVQRYSGHEEIGIGSCVANRPLPQLEDVIGPFANVTILRTDLSGDPTCRQVFRQVREVCLTAFNYQDVPFGNLVHKLQPRFDPARHPIFQILFVLLNAPSDPVEAPDLTIEPIPVDTGTSCFEMNMNVRMHKRFEIDLQYSSDLFEAATIRDFLQDYRAVLESLCANPEARIAELAIKSKHAEMKIARQIEYPDTEYVPASGAIEAQLVELWESVLDKRRVSVNDNFFEIGGDSLRAARLFARIQETFHRSVPLGTLFHSPTVATLAKVISEAGSTSKCLVTIQPGSSRSPLFCVHGQSGSLLMYRGLAQHLGADQLVYGVQPPELENKQPSLTSIEDMASAYVKEVELIQGDGPYFLTGYCMGGTIAFEMAQQLHRRGRSVGLVAQLDTYNWIKTPTSKLENLYFIFQTSWFGLRHFLSLGLQDERKYLRRKYEELWDKETEISEHNKRAAMRYVPKVYEGRILHVRPTRQLSRYKRPELSLDGLAAHGVEEFWLRGYPGQILEEPLVRDLAAKLKACMSEGAFGQSSNRPFPARPVAA